MAVALAGAAVLILVPAAHAAIGDAEQMLHRASTDGTLPSGLASLHTRFGTPARAVDVTVVAMIVRGAREWWASGLAVARLCDRDRRDARADDRVARPAAARTPRPDGVQGAREPALRRPRDSGGAARVGGRRRRERPGDGADRRRRRDCRGGCSSRCCALWFSAAGRHAAPVEVEHGRKHVRPPARRRTVARSDRGPSGQRAGAGPQSASARPRRRRPCRPLAIATSSS